MGTAGSAEEARKEFEEELKIDPSNASAEYYLGEIARQEEKLPEAIEHFAHATKLAPEFRGSAIQGRGRALLDSGKTAEAIVPLETAAHLAPENHYDSFCVGYRLSAHGAEGGCGARVRAAEERGREDQREH